jgi:uncharacterized protein YnzC (UPF0291/DUF896 family)
MPARQREFEEFKESRNSKRSGATKPSSPASEAVPRGRTDVLGPSALLYLQKAAGNASVSSLMAEEPAASAVQREAAEAPGVQRFGPGQWVAAAMGAAGHAAAPQQGTSVPVTTDRGELVRRTGDRLNRALDAYHYACVQVKGGIKAELAEKAEWLSLILEIGFSFAGPLIAKALHSGIEAVVEVKGITEEFKSMAKTVLTESFVEKTVDGAFKRGLMSAKDSVARKNETPQVAGQSAAEDWVDILYDHALVGTDKVDNELASKSDAEVAAIFAALEPETLRAHYVAQIQEKVEELQQNVLAVDDPSKGFGARQLTYVKVDGRREPKPALITMSGIFVRWVPDDMVGMATSQTIKWWGEVRTLDESDVGRMGSDAMEEFDKGLGR